MYSLNGVHIQKSCIVVYGRSEEQISCMYKSQVEKLAIDCGFNGIAFPSDVAIEHACRRGLLPVFTEECCSMAGRERT
jgi:uncharacterized radical SAM superfamily protein